MPVVGIGGASATAGARVTSINLQAVNNVNRRAPEVACGIVIFHAPSAGAQAVATLSTSMNGLRFVQSKTDTNLGGTLDFYTANNIGGQTVSATVTFNKTVNAVLSFRHTQGVASGAQGFGNPEWSRGASTQTSFNIKDYTPNNEETMASMVVVEKGSATIAVTNANTAFDVNTIAGFRFMEFVCGSQTPSNKFRDKPQVAISSSGWLALAYTINSAVFVDVSTAHGEPFAEEREASMQRRADEQKEPFTPLIPQNDVPANEGPSMPSFDEVMDLIRGKQ